MLIRFSKTGHYWVADMFLEENLIHCVFWNQRKVMTEQITWEPYKRNVIHYV